MAGTTPLTISSVAAVAQKNLDEEIELISDPKIKEDQKKKFEAIRKKKVSWKTVREHEELLTVLMGCITGLIRHTRSLEQSLGVTDNFVTKSADELIRLNRGLTLTIEAVQTLAKSVEIQVGAQIAAHMEYKQRFKKIEEKQDGGSVEAYPFAGRNTPELEDDTESDPDETTKDGLTQDELKTKDLQQKKDEVDAEIRTKIRESAKKNWTWGWIGKEEPLSEKERLAMMDTPHD